MPCRPSTITTCLSAVIAVICVHGVFGGNNLRAQAPPVVTTDRPEYLLGDTVQIAGNGFAPNELVTVRVRREDNTLWENAAHQPFVVFADGDGRFTTSWVLQHGTGVALVVWATGSTSGLAQAMFHRGAVVTADRTYYLPGDTAHVTGAGFTAGDTVGLSMENATRISPDPVVADASGRIDATFLILDPPAATHRVRASGSADAFGTRVFTMTGHLTSGTMIVDDGGPGDVPQTGFDWGKHDLLYYRFASRRDVTPRVLDVTIGWNAPWMSALKFWQLHLDTNGNGKIDLEVSHEFSGVPVDTGRFAFVFRCGDTSSIRCEGPISQIGLGGSSFFAKEGTIIQSLTIPLTLLGLPADGDIPTIVNVCGDSSAIRDCVITPGSGFLSIDLVIPGATSTDTFVFSLGSGTARNGASSWPVQTNLIREGAVGSVSYISMPPGNHTLNALIPVGWKLTGASCRTGDAVGPVTIVPVLGPASVGLEDVPLNSGQITRCKFVVEPRPKS